MDGYDKLHEDIKAGRVISAYAAEANGIAEAVSKMAFGNHLGVKIEHDVDPRDFFAPAWGDIVCEVPADKVGELQMSYRVIGEVTDKAAFEYGNVSIALDEEKLPPNLPIVIFRIIQEALSRERGKERRS
jgi:phosphoribosylformylglycinamidine synthase